MENIEDKNMNLVEKLLIFFIILFKYLITYGVSKKFLSVYLFILIVVALVDLFRKKVYLKEIKSILIFGIISIYFVLFYFEQNFVISFILALICLRRNDREFIKIFFISSTACFLFSLLLDSINVTNSGNGESQTFNVDAPILSSGTNLYITSDGLVRAFNVRFDYNTENNEVSIFSLSYLANYYSNQITNSAVTTSTSNLSESVVYNNQKALLYNMIIIRDSTTNLYGVASLADPTNTIIGTRYSSIEFMEGSNDFIVRTSENKMGIIGNDGITKVRLEYDNIVELDKNLGLYLVTSNNRQGVVNSNGKIIVYQDYDQIGLPNTINDTNVTNRYILLDNCIPVQRNGKWGLIDINGNELTQIEYDGFGCDADTSQDSRFTDVLIIPDLNGIVVELDEVNGNTRTRKYGVVTADGNLFISIVLDSVYSLTTQGETTYYATFQGQTLDLVDFVRQQQASWEQNNNETVNETTNSTNTNNVENSINEGSNSLNDGTSN